MATDDRQVLVTGQSDAPAHFRVPGNGQIRPKAITANYDGTNAAGGFLAALKVTSDGGELVGVYPISSTIAAGASARVSWFPGVNGGVGGSGGATTAIAVYTTGITWPDSGPPLNDTAWTLAYPYDSAVFNFANTAGAAVEILAPGKYIVWLTVEWNLALWGTNVWIGLGGDADNATIVSANGPNAAGQGPYFQNRPFALWYANIAIVPEGTTFPLEVFMDGFQSSGADRPQNAQLLAWRIDPSPTP